MMSARSTPNLSQAVHHSGNTVKSSNNFTHHHHQQQLTASFNEKLSPNHSGTIYPIHLHQTPTDGIHHSVNNTNEEKTTNNSHNTTLYPHHLHHQPANVSISEGSRLGQSEDKINSNHTSIYPHHVHHTAPGVNAVGGGFHTDVKHSSHTTSIYSYLHNQSGLNFAPVSAGNSVQISSSSAAQPQVPTSTISVNDDLDSESPPSGSPPPTPPVRDASSLKGVKYGPGHEKYPSWPVAAAADAPQALRGPPSGGSHRSKSWTDHTNYPKEKVIAYTRPYMKRPNSAAFSQQKLKTVMERCEKIPPETYESRHTELNDIYLPRMDREGKAFGDHDYMVPSPPERDVSKPQLNQQELEEYARSYQDQSFHQTQLQHLTQADLEEYTRSYEEALSNQHQKQASYAQSEGYHSYVSSTDSMSTPFLDRLRRDSEAVAVRSNDGTWDETPERERDSIRHEGRDSVVTTSSGSASSSETLKWHGSMSDVSVASSSCTHLGSNANSRQLIAHSARVQTPQRHNSESVLYIGPPAGEQKNQQDEWKERENRNNHHNKLRLFPVNTYTVQPEETVNSPQSQHRHGPQSPSQTTLSVADRISELERQQTRYTYLDPEKRHRVSDPTLKAIQKKALLSFYERHQATTTKNQSWRSEPQLAQSMPAKPQSPPPQPPPRPRGHPTSRRASSASDYAKGGQWRENITAKQDSIKELKDEPRHQHSNSCGSLSNDLLGPVIMGPSISIDDWVPERPPKNPHLRTAFPDLFQEQRIPSPDLPPPSPPMVLENEVFNNDEPFPPPPAELDVSTEWQRTLDRLKDEEAAENIRKKSEQQQSSHIRQSSDQLHTNLSMSTHVRKNSEQSHEMRALHNSEQSKINSPDGKQHQHPEPKPRQSPPKTLPIKKHTFQSEFCNMAMPQVRHSISGRNIDIRLSQRHRPNSVLANSVQNHMQKALYSPTADESLNHKLVNHFVRSSSYDKDRNSEQTVGFAAHRQIPTERASMRHPSTQKLLVNGRVSIAVSQKIQPNGISGQFRAEPLRAHHLYNSENNKRPTLSTAMSEDETLTRNHQRASFAGTERSIFTTNDKSSLLQSQPPPLQPRQARTNQSMRLKHEDSSRFSQAGIVRTSMSGSVEKTGADESRTMNHTTSQSKASYLASYRRGERNQPTDSDRGSYKRTMSPGGHALEPSPPDDNKWPPTITNHRHPLIPKDIEKDPMVITNNNNNSLLHRLSLENKKYAESTKETKLDVVLKKHNDKEFNSTCNNLPDVLPVSAKLSPPRTLSISQNGLNHSPTKTSPVLYSAPSPISTVPRSPMNNYSSINSPPKIASPRRLSKGSPIDLSPGSPKRLINDIDINSTIDNRTNSIKSSPKGSPPTMSPEREIIKSSNRILQRVPSKKESPVLMNPSTRVSPEKVVKHINEKTSSCEGLNKLEDISNQIQKDSTKRFTPELNRSQSVPEVFSKEMSLAEERHSPLKETISETPPKSPQTSPPHSPELVRKNPSPPPTVVEGLQLIQRTEVVLHVNACTTMDAASQTDLREDVEVSEVATMVRTTPVPMRRQKLQEEIECERLSRDLANQLSPSDRLKGLLMPAPEHKKPTDYVTGLFKPEVTSRSRSSKSFRLTQTVSTSTSPPESPSSKTPPQQNGFTREILPSPKEPSSPLSATSTYFTTSESKAKFLTRYSRDMNQYNGIQDTKDLNQKKEELMNRLDRKLEVLRSEQLVVSEDSRLNDTLGEQVNSHVSRLARPQEIAKYRLHVEEVGKITSLLLGLSGRLARVENALMGLESDHAERKILETKRDKLKEQLEEAKKLKENIDRRSVSVSNILYKYLNTEEYADYDHYINMKAKLIMDSREIADKIKLGEEQLTALKETLIVSPTN